MKIGETYAAFAVIFVLLVNANCIKYGEECQTPDGNDGSCIGIRECAPFVESLKAMPIPLSTLSFLRRSQCGMYGRDPLLCCPSTLTAVSLTTPQPTTLQPTVPAANNEVTEDDSQHRNLGLLPKICVPTIDETLVTSGNSTNLYEMPWMALVAYTVENGSPFRCGGTLINDRYVLTAAHCVKFLPSGLRPILVRLGEHDLDSEIDCEEDPDGEPGNRICAQEPQQILIEEIVAHPNYTGRPDLQNDIALIRLSEAADYCSRSIRPIFLPVGLQEQTHDLNSEKVTVAGWGITENDVTSPVLSKATLSITPHDECANAYKGTMPISAVSQLCAGGVKNGGDSCSGDSGGPLSYYGEVQGMFRMIQHGVMSFRPTNCGTQGQPAVYTRVAHFMKWILDNLKP